MLLTEHRKNIEYGIPEIVENIDSLLIKFDSKIKAKNRYFLIE